MEPKKKMPISKPHAAKVVKAGRAFRKTFKQAEGMMENEVDKMKRSVAYENAKSTAQTYGMQWGGDIPKMEQALHDQDIIVSQGDKVAVRDAFINEAGMRYMYFDHVTNQYNLARQLKGEAPRDVGPSAEDHARLMDRIVTVQHWG